MPACLRAALLAGGESCESVWQARGSVLQFRSCWPFRAAIPIGGAVRHWPGLAWTLLGAWLWPPRERCLPLQHSCAPRSPRPDVGLSRVLWPPRLCVGFATVVALLFDWQLVLAVGATWTLSCFARFFLAWPSQRPPCGKEPTAVTYACFEQSPKVATVGNHPRCTRPLSGCLRPMLGLLGADPAAWFVLPPQAMLDSAEGSAHRGLLVSSSPCLRLASWLLVRPLCDAGLVARLCVWLAACLAEWMTLERLGSMARPRFRFMTCSARYLFWAVFCSPSFVDPASDGPSARPHGTTASTSASDPAVPNAAAPAVRTDPAVPNGPAPAVRTDLAAPNLAAPTVRTVPAVPKVAAPAVRTHSAAPKVAAPAVRTPPPAADNPPELSAPLKKDDFGGGCPR
ncbi:hypothetical protein V6N11_031246 [Hibiscus sabdariffa]|uniref:Uncharacterized protein n=1 Tax=Hibiscus sabdariffa TaxID=183260 RepID=A0ABR2SX17_9ROSI